MGEIVYLKDFCFGNKKVAKNDNGVIHAMLHENFELSVKPVRPGLEAVLYSPDDSFELKGKKQIGGATRNYRPVNGIVLTTIFEVEPLRGGELNLIVQFYNKGIGLNLIYENEYKVYVAAPKINPD